MWIQGFELGAGFQMYNELAVDACNMLMLGNANDSGEGGATMSITVQGVLRLLDGYVL